MQIIHKQMRLRPVPIDNKNSRVLPDVHVCSVGPETFLDFFDWPEHMVDKLKTSIVEPQLKDALESHQIRSIAMTTHFWNGNR